MVNIKGVLKTSMIDYPGKIATVIFLSGCNFRCPFCHNPELVLNDPNIERIDEEEVISFLSKKTKWIDAVVITGGEPTLDQELFAFIVRLKELGFLVKLDTNGTNPEIVELLLKQNLLDYIAMDIKGIFSSYDKIVKVNVPLDNIKKTVSLIMDSSIPYEFRSTILPRLHNKDMLIEIVTQLNNPKKYVIQNFHALDKTLDPDYQNEMSFTIDQLKEFKEAIIDKAEHVLIRS